MSPAIELSGVVKRYGDFEAVSGVDLHVPTGATYGLLGPNGAGKTTCIRMLLAIIEPTAGEVRVLGQPVSKEVLDRVGYLPEERGVYRKMTVRRLLRFLAELKGLSSRESAPRIDRWLERFEMEEWRDARLEELSKGMQQKIQFISTVLHEPDVVILDEPFSGLDPINQRVLREIIRDLRTEGRTIVFSTHIIEHAERMCDHVSIIARGRNVVSGSVQQVRTEHGERYVSVATMDGSDLGGFLGSSPLVASVRSPAGPGEGSRGEHEVTLAASASPSDLLDALMAQRVALRRFELVEPSLEQVFIERVGTEAEPAGEAQEVVHV
ncbi:MAG TPA: ATP-binding cassette domain-containing protein [Longimicrobiales bacterium]|nr:ATP-binding cassette domain-containing protein [Longimicrobiales bacterium]